MILQTFVNLLRWETEGEADLERFQKRADDLSKQLGQQLRRGFIVAGAAATAFGVNAFRAASAAEELDSQLGVVFDDNADAVRAWSEATGDALGRSTQEIQRGVVAFQSLFDQAIGGDEAVQLSKDFAVLTQDLASFKDLSNEVAQQKLFSGLSGEAEPLRQVGVFINAAATEAKALELGLARNAKELTDQQKIIARAALIQEALADANGDVIRTFDSATNQIRNARAEFEELSVAIGQDLIPVLVPLIRSLANGIRRLTEWNEQTGGAVSVIIGLTAAIGALLVIAGPFITFISTITQLWLLYATSTAVATGATASFVAVAAPIIAIILAIIAAITLIVLVWRNWDEIVENLRIKFQVFLALARSFIGIVRGQLAGSMRLISGIFSGFDFVIQRVSDRVTFLIDAIRRVSTAARNFVANNPLILSAFGPAGALIGGAAQAGQTVSNIRNANRTTVNQDIKNDITVRGGITNAQTGAAVRDALVDGQRSNRLNRDLVGPVGV